MATSNIPGISDAQLTELEKLARRSGLWMKFRVTQWKYIKDKQWAALKTYGERSPASSASRNLTFPA
jgi:hypothetical protein